MKLVMVGPYPLDINKINGGVEAVIAYLIDGLRKINNLNIQIVSCRRDINEEKIVDKEGIKIHFLPSSKRCGNITFNAINRYRIRKKIREINPDIIHSQNQNMYSYAALETGYPTVITVHGILHKEVRFRKGVNNFVRRLPVTYIERICLKRATDMISISPYIRETFNDLTKARIYSIENPISDKYFQTGNSEMQDRLLFVGPIIKLKDILSLLQVVYILKREISGIELRIAGGVRELYYFEILKKFISKHKIENNVIFLGHITEDQILEEYEKCCLLVLPSSQETAPMVIQQAMAAGKAVIATRVGGIPYLVGDNKTGFLVNYKDTKDLTEKIKLLLRNKELRRQFGKNAKQEAVKRFRAEKIAQETYEVYKQILGTR